MASPTRTGERVERTNRSAPTRIDGRDSDCLCGGDGAPRAVRRRQGDAADRTPGHRGDVHARPGHLDAAPVGAADGSRRRAQRPRRAAGRCRIRADVDVRRADSDADPRRPGQGRPPLHAIPRGRHVFTHARRVDDGPQSARRRHGHDHELVERLPGVHGIDPEVRGVHVGSPEGERVRHGQHRQVAPDPRSGDDAGGPVRSLADAPGFRLLLRLHQRRDRPVEPRTDGRHVSGSDDTTLRA